MNKLCFLFDKKALKEIQQLKDYCKLSSYADTIRRGLYLLKTARDIERANGKLVAMKGDDRTIINIREPN